MSKHTDQSSLRNLIQTGKQPFLPYERYGSKLAGVEWLPLSGGKDMEKEVYLIRFAPGSRSHPHIHQGTEEFLMLEGELTDDDGTVFQAGAFVRFGPNSEHSSFSENGCTALVVLSGGTNKAL